MGESNWQCLGHGKRSVEAGKCWFSSILLDISPISVVLDVYCTD